MSEVYMYYTIRALYGPYSPEFNVIAAADANGLNNRSGVAGAAWIPMYDPDVDEILPNEVGATWQGDTLTYALPVPGGGRKPQMASVLWRLNDSGVAVGWSTSENEVTTAILVSGGNTTDLAPVVGQGTIATDINNAGHVCGWSSNKRDAFVYDSTTNSVIASMPPLNGQSSAIAKGINSADEVVGTSGEAGFCFSTGTPKSLGPVTFVEDINDSGIACGTVGAAAAICDVRKPTPAFQKIPLPPWVIGSSGEAINGLGHVVGSWTAQASDQASAYILGIRTIPTDYEESVFLVPEDFEAWSHPGSGGWRQFLPA
jgi:uncharacterized membrane protein